LHQRTCVDKLKTPYSYAIDFSIGRELGHSFALQVAYPCFCGLSNTGPNATLLAAYNLFSCFANNETTAIQFLDQGFGLADPVSGNPIYAVGGPYSFVDPQFAALYAWRSIGSAAYNGLQVTFQKHMTHGVQFQMNYTYSKSMDISSDAYRINDEGGLGGPVINPWSPNLLRSPSDFDLTHQFNANWIAELPFGKGHRIGVELTALPRR
jgi:hypothetical protein